MIYRFTLTYNGVDTEVCEPRDWKDFQSEIKRDFKSHGVVFKYTAEAIKLGFADGRTILENAFQLEGYDAVVQLSIDRRLDVHSSWSNVFVGDCRMESRELTQDFFNCDFENSTFQQKVVNRLKTNVKLDTTIDLDGNTLNGVMTSNTGVWGTIRLDNVYDAELLTLGDVNETPVYIAKYNHPYAERGNDDKPQVTGTTEYFTFWWGYGVNKKNTLDEINLNKAKMYGDFYRLTDNGSSAEPILAPEKSGNIDFSGTMVYTVSIDADSGAADKTLSYDVKIVVIRGDLEVISRVLDSGSVFNPAGLSYTFGKQNLDYDENFDVLAGDLVFLVIECKYLVSVSQLLAWRPTLEYYQSDATPGSPTPTASAFININQLPISLQVGVKSWFIHDVFDRICYILTGQENTFYSDFFGNVENGYLTDGCGALNVITPGAQLRGIDNELNTSLEDLLEWSSARYGTGWSFEKNYDGSYRVRVEPMEFFYQDNEILDLGSPVSIKENDSYKEVAFNSLFINSVKIGYSKYNTEIDINNDYEDFLTRAEYSLPISSVEGNYSKTSPYIASNDLIQATFDRRDTPDKSWKYDDNIFIVAVQRNQYGIVPENDENFDSVSGLDHSATSYNIRHAPIYMMLDHALLINSALMGKSLDDLIQNVSVKINANFSSQFSATEGCLLGDIQRLTRSATGNIEIGDNFAGLRLFDPIEHELTVAMSDVQFNTLIDAMEGDTPGYLSYRDNEGNVQQGYLLSASWSPIEGIAEIKTLERADNYGL